MNKSILVLILIILTIPELVFTQVDSAIEKRLYAPVINPESIAYNCQEILAHYSINQTDSINKVLSLWKDYCGESEPIKRLEILLAIQSKMFIDTLDIDYSEDLIRQYKYRKAVTNADDYMYFYESNKYYLGYTPLRGKFDNWTQKIAINLLKDQKKGSTEYLFCLLFSDDLISFDQNLSTKDFKEINNTKFEEYYKILNPGYSLSFLTGIWFPNAILSKYFYTSPQIGLSIGLPSFGHQIKLDFAFRGTILLNKEKFDIRDGNTIKSTKGSACLFLGLLISKDIILKNSIYSDIDFGIGMGSISTNIKQPKSSDDTEDKYYGIRALSILLGGGIKKAIYFKNTLGINLNFQYIPFNKDPILISDFASQVFCLSLIYKIE